NDQTQLATSVQGTFGYLDPEYFHNSQLTKKKTVIFIFLVLLWQSYFYSERNLVMHFVSAVKENRLLQILEDHIAKKAGRTDPWRNVDVYIEETECLLDAPTHSLSIDFGIGCSSIRTTTEYDSMRNQKY
ncbi:wall-associated receptor kinase-like 2, partial [Quercus suber]